MEGKGRGLAREGWERREQSEEGREWNRGSLEARRRGRGGGKGSSLKEGRNRDTRKQSRGEKAGGKEERDGGRRGKWREEGEGSSPGEGEESERNHSLVGCTCASEILVLKAAR